VDRRPDHRGPSAAYIHQKKSRAEGTPAARRSAGRREGGLSVTTLVFDVGDQRISADFVDDVLIRFTIMSR
jgi:hypothetical protein